MARGTTGAPRNAPGRDTKNAPAPGFGDPGAERTERGERIERGERGERAERAEQSERAERGERVEQSKRGERAERDERGERGSRISPVPARSGGSRLIAFVCGRRSKYLVVVFWVLVVAALGGLAGKLQGAEKNDASAYLPSSAESTQELNEQNLFQSKNLNPALVVYVRDSGVTAADLQKARADARYFASLPAVNGRVDPPVVSDDHKAIQTVIGAEPRLQQRPRRLRHHREERRQPGQRRAERVRRRAGGQRGGSDQDLQGDRHHPAVRHPGGGDRAAATDLPQPGAVAAADPVRGRGADRGPGRDLPADPARQPDRQRAERGHPGRPGDRREHRLRAVAHRQVPGGTPQTRRPARGYGGGPAPGGPGHHRQRADRRGRHALPARGRIQRHLRARPGRRDRHRRGPDYHDHPAARAPRGLRPVDLLAGQAGLRLGRADQPRSVVPDRPGHRPPPADGVDGDRAPAGVSAHLA